MKRWFSFLFAAIFLLLPGCGGAGEASAQFFAMDTVMTVTVYGRQGKAAVDAARAEINRLDRLFPAPGRTVKSPGSTPAARRRWTVRSSLCWSWPARCPRRPAAPLT